MGVPPKPSPFSIAGIKTARTISQASMVPSSTLDRPDHFASTAASVCRPARDSSASFGVAYPRTRCNQVISHPVRFPVILTPGESDRIPN